MEGLWLRPLGSFHAASQNSFLFEDYAGAIESNFWSHCLRIELFLYPRRYWGESCPFSSALVIPEDSSHVL